MIAYSRFDAYVDACLSSARTRAAIPCYAGPDVATLDPCLGERISRAQQSFDPTCTTVVLSQPDSPAAVCAFQLAAAMGARWLTADDLAAIVGRAEGPVCVVALAHEISDDVLASALSRFSHGLQLAWDERDATCFVTHDRLAALSRYAARLIAMLRAQPVERSFRMFETGNSYATARVLSEGEHAEIQEVASDSVGAIIADADGVLALHGHGGESCANAGGVTVMCGLREPSRSSERGGILACRDPDRGCMRGPAPLPMATLRARHIMQASCSSARLRDAAICPSFNLLLSFLDGEGLSYVGSALGGGRPECCLLYLAAMKEGKTLGAAVTLINAFLETTSLGHAVYVGFGVPELTVARATRGRDVVASGRIDDATDVFELGSRHLATIALVDPNAVTLARSRCLALSVDSDAPVMWFAQIDNGAAEAFVRVFLFSFPTALGTCSVTAFDVDRRKREIRGRLTALERWIDYHRLVAGCEADGVTTGQKAYAHYRDILPLMLDRLAFDGSIDAGLERVAAALDHTLRLVRDLFIVELESKLCGGFWLSNAFAQDQSFSRADRGMCPACGGVTFHRYMRAQLFDEERVATVCMRCGIVADVRIGSAFTALNVACPPTVTIGGQLAVTVDVNCSVEAREIALLSAFSGPYAPKLATKNIRVVAVGGIARASFIMHIPLTMPPHEYRWKCIVADENDVAFLSRCVFVTSR